MNEPHCAGFDNLWSLPVLNNWKQLKLLAAVFIEYNITIGAQFYVSCNAVLLFKIWGPTCVSIINE